MDKSAIVLWSLPQKPFITMIPGFREGLGIFCWWHYTPWWDFMDTGQIFHILLCMRHFEGIFVPAIWLYVTFWVNHGVWGQRGLCYGHLGIQGPFGFELGTFLGGQHKHWIISTCVESMTFGSVTGVGDVECLVAWWEAIIFGTEGEIVKGISQFWIVGFERILPTELGFLVTFSLAHVRAGCSARQPSGQPRGFSRKIFPLFKIFKICSKVSALKGCHIVGIVAKLHVACLLWDSIWKTLWTWACLHIILGYYLAWNWFMDSSGH